MDWVWKERLSGVVSRVDTDWATGIILAGGWGGGGETLRPFLLLRASKWG